MKLVTIFCLTLCFLPGCKPYPLPENPSPTATVAEPSASSSETTQQQIAPGTELELAFAREKQFSNALALSINLSAPTIKDFRRPESEKAFKAILVTLDVVFTNLSQQPLTVRQPQSIAF